VLFIAGIICYKTPHFTVKET